MSWDILITGERSECRIGFGIKRLTGIIVF